MRLRPQHVVLLVVIVVTVVIAGVFASRQADDRAAASESAKRFLLSPSAMPTQQPVAVTVISDDLAAPAESGIPVTEWPVLVASDLGVRVVSLTTAGSGYTTRPLTSAFGGTFEARAGQVASTSRVVLIFGGANDQRATRVQLLRAASATISDAQRTAPRASVVLIGPASAVNDPPESLLAVRSALREAAGRGGAQFVDPIDQGWLTDGTGYIGADDRSLTAKGERAVAARVETVLRRLL